MLFFDLLEGVETEDPDCTYSCGTTVYVYRYDLTLNYKLYASHGTLGDKITQGDLTYTEKVKVSMQDEVSLKYPNFGVVDTTWLGGKAWDRTGRETTAPGYTADSSKVIFDQPVYGTLLLTYRINRDKYSLSLPKRVDAEENKFSSVAYAIYKGGPTWEEIETPPGSDDTDQQCTGGGGGGLEVDPPDPKEYPPYASNVDAKRVVDYCTQEVISDNSTH